MNITAFAQYAGVSKAAVSRYFNGGYLSAEKRAQIAAAVEATGYRPSMQAQMLRTRRTRQIGVIMPRLSSESCARMVEGISRVLDDQNYQLLLINTANDNTREVRALDTLRHDTVDGIILIATMFTPEQSWGSSIPGSAACSTMISARRRQPPPTCCKRGGASRATWA